MAIDRNSAEFQYAMGEKYYFGDAVERDYSVAVCWYRLAAEKGHGEATWTLGLCYEFGRGVTKNIDEAIRFYTESAKLGSKFSYALNGVANHSFYGSSAERNNCKILDHHTQEMVRDYVKTKEIQNSSKPFIVDKAATIKKRTKVFVSYAHIEDEKYFNRLWLHVGGLENTAGIKSWSDKDIKPGDKWEDEITEAMAQTRVAVFLVTPEFLSSGFAFNKERDVLMKAAENGNVKVMWLLVSPCHWKKTPFEKYQAVKLGASVDPLSRMDYNDQEELYAKVAEEIEKVFERT